MEEHEDYRVIGLKPGTSLSLIKERYRALAKQLHPDAGGKATPGSATIQFTRITDAYRRLVKAYDKGKILDFPVRNQFRPSHKAWSATVKPVHEPVIRPKTWSKSATAPKPKASTKTTKAERPVQDVFTLGRIYEQGGSVEQRLFAVRSLGDSGQRTAYAFLRKALLESDETVVAAAVRSIGRLRVRQSVGELGAVFASKGPAVRRAVLEALESIGLSEEQLGLIGLGLNDPDAGVRLVSLSLLGRIKDRVQV